MRRISFIKTKLFFAVLLGLISVGFAGNVSAASVDEVYNNALLNEMFKCYNGSEMNKSVNLQEYNKITDPTRAFRSKVLLNGNSGYILVPTAVGSGNNTPATDGSKGTYATCDTIFLGNGNNNINGVFKQFGKMQPAPSGTVANFANIGYTDETKVTGTTKCINATYRDAGTVSAANTSLGSICWKTSDLDNITTAGDFISKAAGAGSSMSLAVSYNGNTLGRISVTYKIGGRSCSSPTVDFATGKGAALIDGLQGTCDITTSRGVKQYTVTSNVTEEVDASQNFSTVSMNSYAWGYGVAREYFIGNKNLYSFSNKDQFALYNEYIFSSEVYAGSWVSGGECLTRKEVEAKGGVSYVKSQYLAYNGGKYCMVSFPQANFERDTSVFNGDSNFLTHYCENAACVLEQIYNLNLPDDDDEPDPDPNNKKPTNSTKEGCDALVDKWAGGEKIGAMQWILCPTLDNTKYTASLIDGAIDSWLTVDAASYSDKAIKTVWENIRNAANILMVAFLLAVIFSQLTGYGIDNYGIKKMLPRIIMMAILVNLSLYICQIAVDLSNIFGASLKEFFGSMGTANGNTAGMNFLGGAMTGLFSAASAAATGVGLAVTVGAPLTVAVIIILIVTFIVIIVALLVFFVMLGAREIIIIFCVIISPLAFAAFILPNTQGVFKKWWELFKTALIIYPICGAMLGISYLLRSLSNSGAVDFGFGADLILVVLPYLVFFLLPTLLKSALAALGKIGGALTAMGQTVRAGGRTVATAAQRGVQNSEGFKTRQAQWVRNRQSATSQRTIDRLEALKKQREAQGGRLTDEETRSLARAHETQRKLGLEDQAARTVLMEKEYAGKSQKDLMADLNNAFDSGDVDRMNALTDLVVSKYGPGGASDIAKMLENKNIFAGNGFVGGENSDIARSFQAMQANMMQNKAFATNMQNKASDAYQMLANGGFGDDGIRHNLDYHAGHNNMATQVKDWATASNATLKRAAVNGGLDVEMAQKILSSQDQAVQSGILSDPDKRATLEAIVRGEYAPRRSGGDSGSVGGPSADVVIDHSNTRSGRVSDAAHDNPFMNNE